MCKLTTKNEVVTVENKAKKGKKVEPHLVSDYSQTSTDSGKLEEGQITGTVDSFHVDLHGKATSLYWLNATYNINGNMVSMLYPVNNVAE